MSGMMSERAEIEDILAVLMRDLASLRRKRLREIPTADVYIVGLQDYLRRGYHHGAAARIEAEAANARPYPSPEPLAGPHRDRTEAMTIGLRCGHCNVRVREQIYSDEPRPFEVNGSVYHSAVRCRDRLKQRIATLTKNRDDALLALGTAAPAAKWVIDHAPRHDAHDQEHAKLALESIRAAVSVLR